MTISVHDALASRIVPVAVITDAAHTAPLIEALRKGGLSGIEITLRTPAALEAISIAASYDNFCVGAGTVLTIEQADAAIQAGARFIVSPGLTPDIVHHCIVNNIDVIPGVCTPSEVQAAMELGLTLLKFFPAKAMGGPEMLKALGSVYSVRFMPTGGISPENLSDYLALDNIAACGGSWMVKQDLMAAGAWDTITKLTQEAVACAKKSGS